jgi:gas vesicle protein
MKDHDHFDVWAAVAIGAVIGIGTALLVRARQEDDTYELLKRLRPVQQKAQRAAKTVRKEVGRRAGQAGDVSEDLLEAGRDVLEELREGAGEIVRSTRKELRKAARDSFREARRAAQKARKAAF